MSYNQYQSQNKDLVNEGEASLGQREKVKQGGVTNVEEELDQHTSQGSTMHSLDKLDSNRERSPERVSSIHEGLPAGETLHKGWEKATDTIAHGVEVVKRILMSELPPQEKAQELSSKTSEKLDEAKEKVQSKISDIKESTMASLGKSESQDWQPSQERKEEVRNYLYSEGAHEFMFGQSQGSQRQSKNKLSSRLQKQPQRKYPAKPKEQKQQQQRPKLGKRGEQKWRSRQGKVQEKELQGKSGLQEWQTSEQAKQEARNYLYSESAHDFMFGQSQGSKRQSNKLAYRLRKQPQRKYPAKPKQQQQQQRPKMGKRGEQKWRSRQGKSQQSGPSVTEQISNKAQELKEGFKQSFQSSGSQQKSQEFGGQEQQRPQIGKRDEQQWRYQQGESQQSAPSMTEQVSSKAQELKEGFKQSFQSSGSQQKSQEFGGQEQQRPQIGKRDEQQWRYQQGGSQQSSNDKVQEIENLTHQLNQKVEELKKSAQLPSANVGETIIIIQQGENQGLSQGQFSQGSQSFQSSGSQQQSQGPSMTEQISNKAQELKEGFKQSFQPSGSQQQGQGFSGQEQQQRPQIGKRDEQQWRYQQGETQQSGPSATEQISNKAQELKEGFKQSFQSSGSQQKSQEFGGQEQQRPQIGKRDEQQWRYQQGESQQSGPSVSEQISDKAEQLKQGFQQGYEKGLGHPSSQSQGLGDKIKQKAGELKEAYKENVQEFKAQAQEAQPQPHHHESEHHLTTESRSFKPTPQSKHLVEEELLHKGSQSGQTQESQQGSKAPSAGFKPVAEAKNLVKKAVDKMEDLSEQATTSFNERLEGQGQSQSQSQEKPAESQKSGSQSRGQEQQKQQQPRKASQQQESQPLIDKIQQGAQQARGTIQNLKGTIKEGVKEQTAETHDEYGNLRTGPPPAEMTENITYHPRDIRGYEIEYVPKNESEEQQPKSQSQQGQAKSQEGQGSEQQQSQSGTHDERVPLIDRIQHGIEGVSHTIQTIKGLFHKTGPASAEHQASTEKSSETHDEYGNLRTGPAPAEMTETITYHPRDIRGYEIEYVPKNESEGQQAKSQSQQGQAKSQQGQGSEQQHHYEYRRGNKIVEYIEKEHHEGESQQKGQESQGMLSGKASELSNIISQQAENLKHKYSALGSKAQPKEQKEQESKAGLSEKASEKASELSNIISQQADNLKNKYSALGEKKQESQGELADKASEWSHTLPKHSEVLKAQEESHESQEGHGEEKQAGFVSRIIGKFTHGKEEQEHAHKAPAGGQEAGLVSRIMGKFSHGKGESTEETSTEQNQSMFEKLQGKFQGKEKGEEVDKQGFRKVHDGFSETVDELKHEQNEEFIEQVQAVNENPFEPLATKQAFNVAPTSNVDNVGGDLKGMTSDFKEEDQEMIDYRGEEEGQSKSFMQKMKTGLLSKFGRENKENVESADK